MSLVLRAPSPLNTAFLYSISAWDWQPPILIYLHWIDDQSSDYLGASDSVESHSNTRLVQPDIPIRTSRGQSLLKGFIVQCRKFSKSHVNFYRAYTKLTPYFTNSFKASFNKLGVTYLSWIVNVLMLQKLSHLTFIATPWAGSYFCSHFIVKRIRQRSYIICPT